MATREETESSEDELWVETTSIITTRFLKKFLPKNVS